MNSPTWPPPASDKLSSALQRNIATLERRRAQEAEQATAEERIAQAITSFTGSMRFVYVHVALYGGWITLNLGIIPGLPRFDPTFVVLAMVASVEAIFLSTFVLISQNRMAAVANKRADLDLQISLLTEHELTKLATIVSAVNRRAKLTPRIASPANVTLLVPLRLTIRRRLIGRSRWLSWFARREGLWAGRALYSPSRPQTRATGEKS